MARYEPRTVYVISFDLANTDLKYFCSHSDQTLSGVINADVFYGDIISASTNSQGLNPIRANATIGSINFTFQDTNRSLTSLLNSKLLSGDGLRAKRVQHWLGEKGAEWPSGYTLIQTQQIHDAITILNDGNAYGFRANDIQRTQLKNIFDPKKTSTSAELTRTGITIGVGSTIGFELLQHGPSYSDAPNENVLYVKIGDEIIRCTGKSPNTFTVDNAQSTLNGALLKDASTIVVSDASGFDANGVGYIDSDGLGDLVEIRWTSKSGNTLSGVTGVTKNIVTNRAIVAANGRGSLGTLPTNYDYDVNSSGRTKVEEHIYYEMPAIKLAYAILTGTIYGTADVLPEHHQLGISSEWVSASQFIQFSDDIWDPADDDAGIVLRFSGLKKTNAKKFIEEELYFWCGVFSPVLNTGELGLKRMTGVLSDAAHTGIWNEDNVISITNARFDLNDVHNNVLINWNWNPVLKVHTRSTSLSDTDSTSEWGESKTLELNSDGLHGSRHTDAILGGMFNTWRDRYAGPPFKATVTLNYTQAHVKVGDIKRLSLSHLPEFTDQKGDYSGLDMSVEIQRLRFNPQKGTISCDVFGSTRKSSPLLLGRDDASPLNDSWFTSAGSDLSTVSTITSSGSPILTITGGSLVGVDDLGSFPAVVDNDTGIFYWDGDLNISGQFDITKNIELRVNGFVTFNSAGRINGEGAGLTGGINGSIGAIGNSQSGGGVIYRTISGGKGIIIVNSVESPIVQGINSKIPTFSITNSNGTSIRNKPRNLQGSSGGKGSDIVLEGSSSSAMGGNGGNGGSGLVIYCKGASGVSGASIDLSGENGIVGNTFSLGSNQLRAGTGSGGQAGGFALYLIGNTVTETLSQYFVANNGSTQTIGNVLNDPGYGGLLGRDSITPAYSYYTGIGFRDVSVSNLLVDWIPDNISTVSDPAEIASTATLISFTENSNVPQTPAENLATIDITITPPSDTSYSHSVVEYKLASDLDQQYQRLPYPAKDETTVTLSMDGTEYSFRAYPVNLDGVESPDFIQKNFTVSNSKGGVLLDAGNYIQTANNPTGSGGLRLSNNGLSSYDPSGNLLTQVQNSTGELLFKSENDGKRIEINPSNDNEIHFFGDRGDGTGTIEELATIGIKTLGSDNIIHNVGSFTNKNMSIRAQSHDSTCISAALHGNDDVNNAKSAISSGYVGPPDEEGYGITASTISASGASNKGGPLWINCSGANSLAPTHQARRGTLWVTSGGTLYINTTSSSGISASWIKVSDQ